MTITLEQHLATVVMNAIQYGEEKEVINAYKHFKENVESPLFERYVNFFYKKYFRDKYEFRRVKRYGQFFLVKSNKGGQKAK